MSLYTKLIYHINLIINTLNEREIRSITFYCITFCSFLFHFFKRYHRCSLLEKKRNIIGPSVILKYYTLYYILYICIIQNFCNKNKSEDCINLSEFTSLPVEGIYIFNHVKEFLL